MADLWKMACRDLRYAFFREEMRRLGCARIAVAHNADDNVETFLLSLIGEERGWKGLKAMTADNGEIMRPLLEVSRRHRDISRERSDRTSSQDSTNLECDFARNFLRLQVLPLLEQRWPGAKKASQKSIGNLAADFHLLLVLLILYAVKTRCLTVLCDSPAPESLLFHFIRGRGGTCLQAMEMARAAKNPRTGAVWILNDSQEVVCGRTALK